MTGAIVTGAIGNGAIGTGPVGGVPTPAPFAMLDVAGDDEAGLCTDGACAVPATVPVAAPVTASGSIGESVPSATDRTVEV